MKYGVIPTNLVERLALATGKIPVPLIDAIYSLMKARAIMAGVKLGIFEALRDGRRTVDDLARALTLDRECLDLLLRTLVLCEYLIQEDGGYALSKLASRTMVIGAKTEFYGFLLWNYTQWDLIEHLEDTVRTGRGVDFHQTLHDSEAWKHYQRGMLEVARLDAAVIARRVPVRKGATRLLDLAGAHGLLGAAICRKHPPLRSVVVDLPEAVTHARALATEAGIADIVEHRAGDIRTAELGTDYDVALLSNILHHFGPDENVAILRRAEGALKSGGTVAVWELEAPLPGAPVTDGDGIALFFRVTSSARAYHGSVYASWLSEAGFLNVRVARPRFSPGSVLVTGRKR